MQDLWVKTVWDVFENVKTGCEAGMLKGVWGIAGELRHCPYVGLVGYTRILVFIETKSARFALFCLDKKVGDQICVLKRSHWLWVEDRLKLD